MRTKQTKFWVGWLATFMIAVPVGWAQDATTNAGVPPQLGAAKLGGNAVTSEVEASFSSIDGVKVVARHKGFHHHTSDGSDSMRIGQNFELRSGQTTRDVVVISGNANIDGIVAGDLVVLFGTVNLGTNAVIEGDMVVVAETAHVASNAVVKGDLIVVGGLLDAEPGFKPGGTQHVIGFGHEFPEMKWLGEWMRAGLFLGRPLPHQLAWVWAVAGIIFMIHLLLSLLFPRPVEACAEALAERAFSSFLLGLLALVLLSPLCVLLLITGIGILVIPFLLLAYALAFLFGKIAVCRHLGAQLARQAGARVLENALLALLVGSLLLYLVYTIPVIGFVAWGLATILGLGAAVSALLRQFRRENPPLASATIVPTAPNTAAAGSAQTDSPEASITAPVGLAPPPILSSASSAAVALLPHAGFWIRVIAAFLDFILMGLLFGVLGLLNYGPGHLFAALLAYAVAFWTWKGATIGSVVFGLKVVRTDGQPLKFVEAVVRGLSCLFSFFVAGLGFLWIAWDVEKQAWHDKIAGTYVVRVPRGMSLV